MPAGPIIGMTALDGLLQKPEQPVYGSYAGSGYQAQVAVPHHAANVARHYGTDLEHSVVPLEFPHFGAIIEFTSPVELAVCDAERTLDPGLREIVTTLGPVILRNAYLPERDRQQGQRNIFPSLRFHFDRGATQEDRFSLFWRDPFDKVHREPRSSSTLILANAVAYLQARKEGDHTPHFKPLYQLFETEKVSDVAGKIVLEQAWRAPAGTGEISVLDNRTVLHASYYAEPEDRGYPIGVRYLY